MDIGFNFYKKSFVLHTILIACFSIGAVNIFTKKDKDIVGVIEEKKYTKDSAVVEGAVVAETISEEDVLSAISKIRNEKEQKFTEKEKEMNSKIEQLNNVISKKEKEIRNKNKIKTEEELKVKKLQDELSEKQKVARDEIRKLREEKEQLAKQESELKKKYREIEEKNKRELEKKKLENIKKLKMEKEKLKKVEEAKNKDNFKNSTNINNFNEELSVYKRKIIKKVKSNWYKPNYADKGWECVAVINQNRAGEVLNVKIKKCINDNPFQNSVIRAIKRSSPLPLSSNLDIYDDEITITFVVD